MRVSGQLEEASLELLAADPANLPEGRIWENTATKEVKAVLNGIVRKLLSEVSILATANIGDGIVTALKLATDAVETIKIKDANVTTAKIADSNVTTAKIADSNVTTAKLADGSVTQAKRVALNKVESASSGAYSTSSGSVVDVTNLSVSITTTGRPVVVGIFDAGLGARVTAGNSGGNIGDVNVIFDRGGSTISSTKLGSSSSVSAGSITSQALNVPPSSFHIIDTPAAGTYTYKIRTSVVFGYVNFQDCKLVAYEL